MLNINNVASADAARTYYASGDYYAHGQAKDFIGQWHGRAAERLGLEGQAVTPEHFDSLLRNQDPATGNSLTGSTHPNRRAGVDFTFNPPKSLSAIYALTGDERLVSALREAVRDTMAEIETEVMARVRVEGQSHDRPTGNIAWAEFVHFTTRPVEGTPDPHLHVHAVAANLTWDDTEQKWKALQLEEFGQSKDWSGRPRYQAEFYSRLAEKVRHLGYDVRRTEAAFEIDGVPDRVIDEFSRRSKEIDELSEELGYTSPQGREVIARTSRERKDFSLPWDTLQERWRDRLSEAERFALEAVYRQRQDQEGTARFDAAPAVEFALEHLLDQRSAVSERDVFTTALKHGVGSATVEGVRQELANRKLIRAPIDGVPYVSTPEVLAEEEAVLAFAQNRRGRLSPLHANGMQEDARLSAEQRQAVRHVWNSRDPLVLIRGKAGTGKTTMMKEAIAGIERAGHEVTVLAPTAKAARGVLKEAEGFANATTVADFLGKEDLQEQARGQVIWCDEAGLLGFADMAKLVRVADQVQARLVLSGDRKQLRSVSRGEPLAVLEDLGGLPVAVLKDIKRQKGAYKAAVERLAGGDVAKGLDALDAMGAVKAMPEEGKYAPLVEEYIQGLRDKKDMLILCPSHKEGEALTSVLRDRLKQEKRLGKEDHEFERLVPLHLSPAQRSDPQAITGSTAVFVRHCGRHRAGQRVEVTPEIAEAIAKKPDAFATYRRDRVRFAAGDLLRITANGRDKTGKHRVDNGNVYRIRGFSGKGDVILDNGWTLDQQFGKWGLGYAHTSYAGQGSTVDKVLLAVSAASYGAANARQAYVDASRGRESVSIYTDDRQALRQAMQREQKRPHALDLVTRPKPRPNWRERFNRHLDLIRRVSHWMRATTEQTPHERERTVSWAR